MRRDSFLDESMASSEEDLKELITPYNKKIIYTFNDIDIDYFLFSKNCLLYLNVLGILILFFTFYSNNLFFSQINDDFYLIKPIFFLVSIFLIPNCITTLISISKDEEDENKKILINQYSINYTSSLYFICLYFLTYHFIPNDYDMKKVYLVIFSIISLFLISISYINYKEKEKNLFYKNIFYYISLSISLSVYSCFNLIILINTFMQIIDNSISVYGGGIISIILITYYNDIIFSIIYFIYQVNLIEKLDLNDSFFVSCIINAFCLIFIIITNNCYEKFNIFSIIKNKECNEEEQKYIDDESVTEIYNKQKNYYDSY